MRTLRFKIITLVLCIGMSTMNAQKLEKKYSEKFTVNKDIAIDINTRYTDIEIETWDRNEVVIEAYIQVEGETTQKAIDDYLKRWNFEALGNKSSIKITSNSSGLFDVHTFNFDEPNYDNVYPHNIQNTVKNLQFVIPEISVDALGILDSLHVVMPDFSELTEFISVEPLDFDFHDSFDIFMLPEKFDFKKFKKNKNYLKEWKKRNEKHLKGADVKVGKNSISITINEDDEVSKEELEKRLKEIKKLREVRHKEHKEKLKKRQTEMKIRQQEMKMRVKERNQVRKLALVRRQEAHEKRTKELVTKRIEIRDILAKREKSNIKRIIKIKAPKGAKFNMNVRYGSMSFPKN